MYMIATRANVEQLAISKGYTLEQVDGIPEGFSWREPDIDIGGKLHKGRLVTFEPLQELKPHYE